MTNIRYAVGNNYRGDRSTAEERTAINTCNAIWDSYVSKACATAEGLNADGDNAAKIKLRELSAVYERTVTDNGGSATEGNLFKIIAALKRGCADGNVTVADNNLCKGVTIREDVSLHSHVAVTDHYLFKRGAAPERLAIDSGYAVGNADGL